MSIKLHSGSALPRLIEGISPEVKLESVDGGVRMTVTTKSGSKSIIIPKGEIGETGPQGLKGDTGDTGIGITDIVQNEDGTLTIELDDGSSYLTEPLKGETGETGPQGPKGDTGTGIQSTVLNQDYTLTVTYTDGTSTTTSSIRGEQGAQGIQGIQGPKGDTGAKGDQGIQGEKGDKGDKGDTGATGAQGPKGDTGSTGATPQLSIGTVETLDPGDDATATISGTTDAPVLNFGIPQGDPGEVTQVDLDAAVADIEQTIGTVPTGKTVQGQIDGLYTDKAPVIISSASGFIATFTDGADDMPLRSLSVAIEPVQDLHGQDSPYPAGGGKNKLPFTEKTETINTAVFTINADGTVTTSGTPTSSAFFVYNRITLPAGAYKLYSNADMTKFRPYVAVPGGVSYDIGQEFSASDNQEFIVYLHGITGQNLNGQTVTMMICLSTETDTSFAPYSNICPISGWTGANVSRTGKNLFDKTDVQSGYFLPDGSEAGSESSLRYRSNYILVTPDEPYYFTNIAPASATIRGIWYTKDKAVISTVEFGANSDTSGTQTAPDNAMYVRIVCYKTSVDTVMVHKGSTSTAYEPYFGETIEYEFPSSAGTVYGGTLTIHQDGTGELVVDRANVDLGTLTWGKDTSVNRFASAGLVNAKQSDTTHEKAYCSMYELLAMGQTSQRITGFTITSNGGLYIYDATQEGATPVEFKAYVSGQKLVYPITTQTTYNLTALEVIDTLKGKNVLWSSTGPVSIEYPADTRLFIEKKISELQALILENISNS